MTHWEDSNPFSKVGDVLFGGAALLAVPLIVIGLIFSFRKPLWFVLAAGAIGFMMGYSEGTP